MTLTSSVSPFRNTRKPSAVSFKRCAASTTLSDDAGTVDTGTLDTGTIDTGTIDVVWDAPQRRVAPGQSVVFYDLADQVVLGGGIAAR
jgi:tRNA U34 2-thiouridine synthase MnmA/TrmU